MMLLFPRTLPFQDSVYPIRILEGEIKHRKTVHRVPYVYVGDYHDVAIVASGRSDDTPDGKIPQHFAIKKPTTRLTYPNAGLATGAKAAAEATVAIRQKAVFIVKSYSVLWRRELSRSAISG
jgi:hypothetical protein